MVRTVTVKNYADQSCNVFEDIEVTTWGELRRIIENGGISTEGMSVKEGVSKVNFLNDESVLPHDIPFKGSVTNDLFILLFPKEKEKLNLGGVNRADVVAKIKELSLEEVVKETTGRNWTQVPTATLLVIVQEAECGCEEEENEEEAKPEHAVPVKKDLGTEFEKFKVYLEEFLNKLLVVLDYEIGFETDNKRDLQKSFARTFGIESEKGFSKNDIAEMEAELGL